MSAESHITQGALRAIFSDPAAAERDFPVPVLQCLQVKPISAETDKAQKYKIVLSDIQNYVQCVLGAATSHNIHSGKLVSNCIVRLKAYNVIAIGQKGKKVLVVGDLEVIEALGIPQKFGAPTQYDMVGELANAPIPGNKFYGTKTEEKSQPQQGRKPADKHGGVNIYPIEALSPYAHKWTIKARVTFKSDIKTWHKSSGEGKLFSVNLLDETGEIKATGFNDQVDQFFDIFQEGSVYYISNPCRINMAKKQFSNLSNDYEMVFERDTVIEKAEDQDSVPQVRFNFCNLQELNDVEKDATVDVIGVLKEIGETSEITSKTTSKSYEKRELTLVDDSNFSVRVTIWGKTALSFDAQTESVIAFKGAKVSDFGGRSLSLLSSGTMAVNPDIPDAHRLKGWYDAQGRTESFNTHSNLAGLGNATGRKDESKLILQIKEERLGMDKDEYFTLKATVVYIKQDNFAYPACPNQACNNKKVTDEGDGTWRCEKCNASHAKPLYRYVMSVNVCDHTGQLWLSCFDDVGRMVMGKSADEVMELREEDDVKAGLAFEDANCRGFTFRVRAKMDTYQDQQRVRYQAMSAAPIDFNKEGNKLAEMIKQYNLS